MLARLAHDPFSDPRWIYERKFDGERVILERHGRQVRLLSRNRETLNHSYPEIVDAVGRQELDHFIIDGEVVAFEGNRTSFARLQQRMQVKSADDARRTGVAVYAYVFDVLLLGGRDLRRLPLLERRRYLREALSFNRRLRGVRYRRGDGESYLKTACQRGWEGLIAKRADAPYVHRRSSDWLKLKCVKGQELVIGGFTDPKGSRTGFGALLVGYYERHRLRYAGKVGTGFSDRTLAELRKTLNELERKTSPFAGKVGERSAHWVTPRLVGQFAFTEWTRDGKLRHPRFQGLRRDKAAHHVRREN